MSWDADLRFEVPGACRLLCFALEAFIFVLGRSGLFYSDGHVGAELLQLERVVSGYVAVFSSQAEPMRASPHFLPAESARARQRAMPLTRRSSLVQAPLAEAGTRPRRSTKRAAAPAKVAPTKVAPAKAPLSKAQATARANAALLTTAAASLDEAVQANKRPRRKSGDPGSAADVEAEAEVESEEETDVDAEAETGGDTSRSRRITQRRTRAARDYRGMSDGDDDDDDDYDSAAAEEEEAEEEEEPVEMGRGKRKRRPTHLLESDDSEAEAGRRTAGKRAREGGGWLVPRCRACAGSHRKHTCGKAKVERR